MSMKESFFMNLALVNKWSLVTIYINSSITAKFSESGINNLFLWLTGAFCYHT